MQYEPFEIPNDSTNEIRFIGIDFGTYKCAMYGFDTKKQEVKIIWNAEGEATTRSIVYYGEEEEVLVGTPAQNMLDDPEQCKNVVSSVKRHLTKLFHYPVLGEPTPVQVAAEIFRKLKLDAKRHYHAEVTHAVVTYPVTFTQGERDMLLKAAKEEAGFQEVQLLKEPEAAARAFVQEGYRPGNCVLVYDLGAGTFDLALLVRDPTDGIYHAEMGSDSDGYWYGGDDFDRALYDYWDQLFIQQYGRPIGLADHTDQKFLDECRKRKELLSNQLQGRFSSIVLDPEQGVIQFKYKIDAATFERLIHSKIKETVVHTLAFFERAQASGYKVDTVVLIGGSSQIPLVKQLLQEALLPLEPQHWDKWKLAVALGAAYHANDLWGNQEQTKQYRQAVEAARLEGTWNGEALTHFTNLAQVFGLTDGKKEYIEREVLGLTIRDLVESLQSKFTPTVSVSQEGQGQFTTIGEAIRQSPPGTTILVRQGRYTEQLIIDKPLEIIGISLREDVIVESTNGACILMKTDTATVSNLTLSERVGTEGSRYFAVDIPQGQLVLNNCDITSDSLSCVGIHGSTADPSIRKCKIHSGGQHGVLIYDRGKGTVEDCDISGNSSSGVEIKEEGNTVIRECIIHDGKSHGIYIHEEAVGTVEHCDIFGNTSAGIRIKTGGNPIIQRCRLHHGKDDGICIDDKGKGIVENCDIFSNRSEGVTIAQGSNPTIRQCKIHEGQDDGIYIHTDSKGLVENCDIFGNAQAGVRIAQRSSPTVKNCDIFGNGTSGDYPGIWIKTGSNPVIQECRVHDAQQSNGIWAAENGQGTVEGCDIFGNADPNVGIKEESTLIIRRCKIHDGKKMGINIWEHGRGTIEECEIFGNASAGVGISDSNNTVIRRCKIRQNGAEAVWVSDHSAITVENCELTDNVLGAWDIRAGCQVKGSGNTPNTAGILQMLWKFESVSDVYVYPDIPSDKLSNAKSTCNVAGEEQILALIDCTTFPGFGTAKDCVLFGTEGIYYRNIFDTEGSISYSSFPMCTFEWVDENIVRVAGLERRISVKKSQVHAKTLCKMLDAIKDMLM